MYYNYLLCTARTGYRGQPLAFYVVRNRSAMGNNLRPPPQLLRAPTPRSTSATRSQQLATLPLPKLQPAPSVVAAAAATAATESPAQPHQPSELARKHPLLASLLRAPPQPAPSAVRRTRRSRLSPYEQLAIEGLFMLRHKQP